MLRAILITKCGSMRMFPTEDLFKEIHVSFEYDDFSQGMTGAKILNNIARQAQGDSEQSEFQYRTFTLFEVGRNGIFAVYIEK